MKKHNVHEEICKGTSTRKTARGKKAAALALCVSLWMAGGSAEAEEALEVYIDINATPANKVHIDDGTHGSGVVSPPEGTTGVKSLTVTGVWSDDDNLWSISGGKSTKEKDLKDVDGFSLILDGAKNVDMAYGGFVPDGYAATVSNNFLLMKNSRTTGNVAGGFSQSTAAEGNHATLTDSTVEGSVYGGVGSAATGNTATLTGSRVTEDVYGGYAYFAREAATGNTVSLTNATINGSAYGGYHDGNDLGDLVTGNTLNLFYGTKANTVAGKVANFETINIKNLGAQVLTLTGTGTGIAQNGDGSKAVIRIALDHPETYVPDSTETVLINCTGTGTINADLDPTQKYTPATGKAGVIIDAALTGTFTLSDDKQTLSYKPTANQATKLILGANSKGEAVAIPWSTTEAYCSLSTDYKFTFADAAIDATALTFKGTETTALKTDGTSKMTLLSGATGITDGNITQPTTSPTVAVDFTDAKGVNFAATATGAVTVATDAVNFTINSVAVDNVTLGSLAWGDTDTLPTGWTVSDATKIDAKDFAFTGKAMTTLAVDETAQILKATGLTEGNTVTSGTGKTVAVDYTDKEISGLRFDATATGNVTAATDEVKFTVSGVTLNSVNLAGWNGTTGEVPAGWTGAGVTVAGSVEKGLDVGDSKDILTNGTAGMFTDAKIDKAVRYVENKFEDSMKNGVTLSGVTTGGVKATQEGAALTYFAEAQTLDSVDLAKWDSTKNADKVPDAWRAKEGGVTVETAGMTVPKLAPETTKDILTAKGGIFADAKVNGDFAYDETAAYDETVNGVTVTGIQPRGVKASGDGTALVYEAGTVSVSKLAFTGEATTADLSKGYDFSDVTAADVTMQELSFASPQDVDDTYTQVLLKGGTTLANLTGISVPDTTYPYNIMKGVDLEGVIRGSAASSGGDLIYKVSENKAAKLTFRQAAWNETTPLIDHGKTLTNVSFDGADVDTGKGDDSIVFTGADAGLKAGQKMTLVSDFGESVGTITDGDYRIGTGRKGKGSAELVDGDLVFNIETSTTTEQSHNTVMGAEVSMAALSAGNDFIGAATEGLALASNVGADGVSTFAKLGGGNMRQETGSHVDAHTWNAVIALGHKNEKEKSSFQYGAFFEYGTGNYTTHADDGSRGDGSAHYTGGGLLAKWTANHGFYVEGSLRAGTLKDDARNVMTDGLGNPYSYETSTGYWGAHIGVGKEIALDGGNTVDVYAKYFHNHRNGVSFDAGDRYDLDAVTSSVLRVGARYTMVREKWNFYGGLAYEHELDGKARGTVRNGFLNEAIRAADTSGGSVRAELGATMKPEGGPWSLDLNLTGFAGKKRGVMGGISVAWMF